MPLNLYLLQKKVKDSETFSTEIKVTYNFNGKIWERTGAYFELSHGWSEQETRTS